MPTIKKSENPATNDYIQGLFKKIYPNIGYGTPRKNYVSNDLSGEEISEAMSGSATVSPTKDGTKISFDDEIVVDGNYESKIPEYIKNTLAFDMPSPVDDVPEDIDIDYEDLNALKAPDKVNSQPADLSLIPDLVASTAPSLLALFGGASPHITSSHFDKGNAYAKTRSGQEMPDLRNTDVYVGPDGRPVRRLIKDSTGLEKFYQSKASASGGSDIANRLHSVLRVEHKDGKPEFYTMNKDGTFNPTGLMPDRGVTTMVGTDPEGNKIYRQGSKNFPGEAREIGRTEGYGERTGFPVETMKQVQKIQDKHVKTQQEIMDIDNAADHVVSVVSNPNSSPNSVAAAVQNLIRMLAADTRISDMDARLILAENYKTYARQIEDWYEAKFRGKPMTPETRASILEAIDGVRGRNSDLASSVYDMYQKQAGMYSDGGRFFEGQFPRPKKYSSPKAKKSYSEKAKASVINKDSSESKEISDLRSRLKNELKWNEERVNEYLKSKGI